MSGYYPYGQSYNSFFPDEWLLQLAAGMLAVMSALVLLLGLALYVLRAVGLYKMAKNRAIRCAWLAWIPVAGDWVLGSISDQYQYVVKGRIRGYRFVLVILSAVVAALGGAISVLSEEVVANLLGRLIFGSGNVNTVRLIVVVSLSVLCGAGRLAYTVFSLLAHFDLYRSSTNKYSVLYLVLTIFFSFLEPIFVFICRNKDEGMPPRKVTLIQKLKQELACVEMQEEPAVAPDAAETEKAEYTEAENTAESAENTETENTAENAENTETPEF